MFINIHFLLTLILIISAVIFYFKKCKKTAYILLGLTAADWSVFGIIELIRCGDLRLIFESIMLLCFGAAWPFSICHQLKTKKSHGKSVYFLAIVLAGYVSGMLFKISGNIDKVFILYVLNFLMVALDLVLTLKYRDKNDTTMNEVPGFEE